MHGQHSTDTDAQQGMSEGRTLVSSTPFSTVSILTPSPSMRTPSDLAATKIYMPSRCEPQFDHGRENSRDEQRLLLMQSDECRQQGMRMTSTGGHSAKSDARSGPISHHTDTGEQSHGGSIDTCSNCSSHTEVRPYQRDERQMSRSPLFSNIANY